MSAKKKAPQSDAGLFCLMMPDAAGENQKSKSRQGDYIKEPESSAVKGAAVADGAIAPLTARTAAADNSAAGSYPYWMRSPYQLNYFFCFCKNSEVLIIYMYMALHLLQVRGSERKIE